MSQIEYSQAMYEKYKDLPDFKNQLEIAYSSMRRKYGKVCEALTCIDLPSNRLRHFCLQMASLLSHTASTDPLYSLFREAAYRIHIISRESEAVLYKADAQAFMLKLGTVLECSDIVSAHRAYLNDWEMQPNKMNFQALNETNIMLLNDMVLVLSRHQERSGAKIVYRVQKCIAMEDILDIDRDVCDLTFLAKYSRDQLNDKIEGVFRFNCFSEGQCQTMYNEIKHVWISHNWGHFIYCSSAQKSAIVCHRER
ncbi:hypothetical protein BDR26DRAFT_589567 [Obelidium mucronatum]|nr:hypothetical protein BDR26DRAFT_589567 [Obelidium mucronatum]